jgi:Right handed beta helix region
MKTITFILLPALIITGCVNENKNASDRNTRTGSSVLTSVLVPDTIAPSVVWPVIPDRKITVGGENAEIKGFTSEAIQTAIDALHQKGGGGTIFLFPGNFDIIAPVRLYDNMALVGSGATTILKKCKGVASPFALDADYGELQVTVPDASGFKPGMGVAIYDDDQRSGWALTTARITTLKGNTIYLNDYLLRDYHTDRKGTISNACSVIESINAENIRIANLTIDGSKETNTIIDGCRAGGIYLHKVHRALVENVTVKNFNSDGISWQITEYVKVRNCEVFGCTNSGLHPGTGSPYSLIEGNNSHNNGGYGLFVCWRVRNGIVRNNSFHHNGINGISTGHKDTDLIFEDNHIFLNAEDGVTLRGEATNNEPDGTILRHNIIEDNGTKKEGYGISVYSPAKRVVVENNTIRNTGSGKQLAAVYLSAGSLPLEMKGNEISGMTKGEVVKDKR